MDTNLDKVKFESKLLFDAVPLKKHSKMSFVCQHPFTNSSYGMSSKGEMIDYTTEEGGKEFRNIVFNIIDNAKDVFDIVMLLNKAYYMTFLNMVENDVSPEDFGKLLQDCWVLQEFPNRDNNVGHRKLIKWFKKCPKTSLMVDTELFTFDKLKQLDKLLVYRGVEEEGQPNGLSWTISKPVAQKFANRFHTNTSRLYVMEINPENILAYFNSRNEQEVIIDTTKEHNWILLEE